LNEIKTTSPQLPAEAGGQGDEMDEIIKGTEGCVLKTLKGSKLKNEK